jgi:hypothetical protein
MLPAEQQAALAAIGQEVMASYQAWHADAIKFLQRNNKTAAKRSRRASLNLQKTLLKWRELTREYDGTKDITRQRNENEDARG